MNKLNIVKKSVAIVVSFGAGNIIKQIIDNNTETPDNAAQKVANTAGAYALGSMVGAAVAVHTDKLIDDAAAQIAEIKLDIKDSKKK